MRERITDNWGSPCLQVYPHADENTPDVYLTSAGYVEAIRYWTGGVNPVPMWGVRISIAYPEPLQRDKTDELQSAIRRCWEWIDENRKRV